MSYLVLARKWRPMSFEDLVGQEHVSRTLSNAIATGRVAHAFLFTGVRGVGKTTSARILAKALNCEKGPTPTPCLACSACTEIATGIDIDVQEIDGASYNGVDEVRRLQESLPYRPSRDRFKIVIVDEVHMLSQNAWNAFLKTLEEPPPHVKFVFCTTEAHKVPVTILSRCQRYDFKLIPSPVIARRLRFVLDQEAIQADDATVTLLAREAAGSMRDGMSLLDQAIAWGGNKLVGEEISQALGVAGHSVLHELVAALVRGDGAACIAVVERIVDRGYDLLHVARNLLESLRDLVVFKICREPERLVDLTGEQAQRVAELAAGADLDDLLRLHLGFSVGFDQMAQSAQQRFSLEMLLVRLARRPPLLPVDDLLGRLSDLERRMQGGKASAARTEKPRASRPPPDLSQGSAAVSAENGDDPCRGRVTAGESGEPAAVPVTGDGDDADRIAAWRAVLAMVHQQNVVVASVLEHAVPLEISPQAVRVGFEPGSFYEAQARHDGALDLLTRIVRTHFGQPTVVSFTLNAPETGSRPTVYDIDEAERLVRENKAREEIENHPLVQVAARELGARIVEIRLAGAGQGTRR